MGEVVFTVGNTPFYLFGLMIAFAVIIGLIVTYWQCIKNHQKFEHALRLVCLGIPLGFLSARLYYIFTHDQNTSILLDNIWYGGFSFIGAMPILILMLSIYTRYYKLPIWRWLDIIVPGLALGQAMSGLASFLNQEDLGFPTQWWGIYIDYDHRPYGYEMIDYFNPVSLYIVGLMLGIFLIIITLLWLQNNYQKFSAGTTFLLYTVLYCTGMFYIEPLRLDCGIPGALNLTRTIMAIGVFAGIILMIFRNKRYSDWVIKEDV